MTSTIIQGGIEKVTSFSVKNNTSDDLAEKFESLFPVWTTVVATLISLLIILFVLTKYLYNPVKKMHDDRRDYIQNNIDAAELEKVDAISDREKANDELIQARMDAAEIVNQAKITAEQVKAERIAKAEIEAAKVIADAKANMEAQQHKFEEESSEAIVEVAMAAAAKVIEKEVDNKTNRKIVENYIKAKK